ncbi:MAG: ABC transporter substrate-binding protein [Ignavibacteriae bacterium]|nr:ABC transporter substrate-binding protein [Ignavibacteriota bacterium]
MKNIRIPFSIIIVILISALLIGCGTTKKRSVTDTKPVSVKQFDTPPGADPSVSAEMGGEGFTGEGWETYVDYNIMGDPNANKGGYLTMSIADFPSTLRNIGKDENSYFNRMAEKMVFESLLGIDPVNEKYTPRLATHWWVSEDKRQFKFRIDPDARWADGKPVVAEDVVATWKLLVDPGILSPYSNILYNTYEEPVAESKYIVSVKTKELNWRQFLYFASMSVFPSHIIGGLSGKDFLEKFQFEPINGSGPYIIDKENIKKGQSITMRRRSDYWAEDKRFNTGINNFDVVRFDVVSDDAIEFEKFKKGDLDVINVLKAQRWEEQFNFPDYERGLVVKKRVYNEKPTGTGGICFNMRRPFFSDIRMRKAFAMLYDRKKFNEKLFFNSYEMMYSYYPGSIYENPDDPKVEYNLDGSIALLEEMGWTEKNADGYRTKDGKQLEVELVYGAPSQERYLTIYQEDCKKAGIKLNLRQVDGTTAFQLGNERNFDMITINWGGLRVPNPESSLKSNTADEPNTTNWPGIKDPRIDQLCDQYNLSFDRDERVRLVQEIDKIATEQYGYAFAWYGPFTRLAFHNKFGYPKYVLPRTEGNLDADQYAIPILWYIDAEKLEKYNQAKTDNNITMDKGNIDVKYWTKVKEKEVSGTNVAITPDEVPDMEN